MGGIRDERNPMPRLRIDTTGNTGIYATLNVMAQSIEGIVGKRSVGVVNAPLAGRGLISIPSP